MFTPNEVAAGYGYDRSKNYPGVIAQEIKAVLPEAVVPAPFDTSYDDDGNRVFRFWRGLHDGSI
jgi:hypothetical protein